MEASDLLGAVVGIGHDDTVAALGAGLRRVLVELPLEGWVIASSERYRRELRDG